MSCGSRTRRQEPIFYMGRNVYEATDSCNCVLCAGNCRHLLWLEHRLNGKAAKGSFYLSQEPGPGGPCAVSLETNSVDNRKPLKCFWAGEWGDKICAVGKINNGLKEFKGGIQQGTRLDKGEQETIATVQVNGNRSLKQLLLLGSAIMFPGLESTLCKHYLTEGGNWGQEKRGELKDIEEAGSAATYWMWGGDGEKAAGWYPCLVSCGCLCLSSVRGDLGKILLGENIMTWWGWGAQGPPGRMDS